MAADLLHNKLLHSSPFPLFSFSHHSNFSSLRFIPLRSTRHPQSSVIAKLSPHSPQFDLISSSENSDGSIVFNFGDASDVRKSVEIVDSRDANTEILETSDVNDVNIEPVGRLIDGFDVKSEGLETRGDEFDASDEKLEVLGISDVDVDVNDVKQVLDAIDEKRDVVEASDVEFDARNYARDDELEVVSIPDGDDDTKLAFAGSLDVELDVNDVKQVIENSGVVYDASNEKSEVRAVMDVELEVLRTLDGETDECDANDVKSEVVGTTNGYVDIDDTKSELVECSDVENDLNDAKEVVEIAGGEYDASDEKLDVVGASYGESEAGNEKLENLKSPDGENYASDEKSEVEGTLGGEDDEHDQKSEVVLDGESNASSEESVVVAKSVVGFDDTDAKLEVLEASNGGDHIHDEESKIVVTSTAELDVDGAKLEVLDVVTSTGECESVTLEVLEVLDGELDVSDAKSEMLANSDGEQEVKLGRESINDAELLEVKESEGTEVELSVNGIPDSGETVVETMVQTMELVGSTGITNEILTNSVTDSVSTVQFNRDSNVLSDDGDSVELIPQPIPLEAEPIGDDEAILVSVDSSVALESILDTNMRIDAAPSTDAQPDNDSWSGDVLEAVASEASRVILAETDVHRDKSKEVSPSALSISTAAVSLPHPLEALTGGEDSYFICQNWFGVADGVGQWSLEGITKGLYAQDLMQNCEKLVSNSQYAGLNNIMEVLQQSAAATQSSGSARVLIANFDNEVLHVANIGDSGFVIIRNGAVVKKSSPMVHEFNFPYALSSGDDPLEATEEYHVELEDGDVIVTATDGLFDNLYEQEIASVVSKSMGARMKPKDIAELLAMKSQEVGKSASARCPFADAAQAAGHTGYIGGKLDHVTAIVSFVQIS